jgi:tetratricopeptide (TPR) repeat protein
MKRAVLILAILAFAGRVVASEDDFRRGMEALAARDYPAALSMLEVAVGANPDSVRYASEYRQAVIVAKQYDRCLKFFEKLVAQYPKSGNAHLNYGFAYVDKIPAAGSITQVILANTALSHFTKAAELEPSWIAYYTRGNSYLFWPRIFNRAPLGLADLEQAMKLQKADKKRSYHVRVFVSLGDGYWKMDDLEKARATWQEGLKEFPDDPQLKARLGKQGDDLKAVMDEQYDPAKRVDTNLKQIWMEQ